MKKYKVGATHLTNGHLDYTRPIGTFKYAEALEKAYEYATKHFSIVYEKDAYTLCGIDLSTNSSGKILLTEDTR